MVQHPEDAEDAEDAEALRRRLYRPGASPSDLACYLHATAEERTMVESGAAPSATAPPRPLLRARARARARAIVLGGSVVAAAALVGAVLLTSGPPSPAAAPTAGAPTAVAAEPSDGAWHVAFGQSIVFDGGERAHARGSSVAEGPEAVRYTIAPEDTVVAIASRFQLCPGDVLRALPYGFDPAKPPSGGSLELSRDASSAC